MIADHLDWIDLDRHARLLQAKVDAYMENIESGRLWEHRSPKVREDAKPELELALLHAPTPQAEALIQRLATALHARGVGFAVRRAE